MQESTRERLFISVHDFLLICLHQPQYCFCLHYRNQGGLHLAYMRSMSSLENPMVISYYFHYPVQAQAHGIKSEGETYKIAQKIFCRKNRVTCLLRPRPLRAYVATCLCASNYYVQTCLSSFYYYVPKCLYVTSCLRALNCYVPTCPSVFFYYVPLRAYVPVFLSALNYYVLTCLRALNYYEPTCPHFSCAFICLRAIIYFSCLRTFVS